MRIIIHFITDFSIRIILTYIREILEIYENYNMLKICCNVLVMVGLFSCVFGDSEDVVLVRPLVKNSIF